ncbi:zinc transporter ZIP3-like [Dermacentor silvarum]|uniref:zinc transporter ZIP3-like n=1 Tax=Dermacentor silvarum TaxID=543639 RepID=UPI00210149F4|nr:zinc transporter ZIP3-like [Dermacentor silvarum]
MESSADTDVTLVQVQTALFGLSLNSAVYAVTYMVAASACVDSGLFSGFARPTRSQQRHRRDRALSYVRCFAAGVFLGTLFLAMMPAVRTAVQAAQEEHNTVRGAFPFAEALVFACFCAALYADGTIAATTTRRAGAHSRVSARESPAAPQAEPASPSSDSDLIDSPENSRTRLLREEDSRQNRQQPSYAVATRSERGVDAEPSYCGSDDDTDANGPSAAYRLAFTVGAMAVHSVLEGLALGLQDDAIKLVWLVVGVYMHKTLVTVAVALNAAAMEHSSIVAASAGLLVASTVPAGQVGACFAPQSDQPHLLRAELGLLCQFWQLTYHMSAATVSIKPTPTEEKKPLTFGVCHSAVAVPSPGVQKPSVRLPPALTRYLKPSERCHWDWSEHGGVRRPIGLQHIGWFPVSCLQLLRCQLWPL